jgi:fructose-bisphosphate aldolase class I
MNLEELNSTARALVDASRGILAADESTGTITKRFASIDLESTEENRRAYRDMLFTAPGLESTISGVILFEETLYQATADGTAFSELLASRNVIPGIKVDKGAKPMALCAGETITEGLDGLRERLQAYREAGARFAKWRAVIRISEDLPTAACIDANAHALARYAALCQEQGIVPIVEPEVLMDGEHDIDTCEDVTSATLGAVFGQLDAQGVALEGMLLKPNMIISGSECPEQADVDTVAVATVRTLTRYVPAAVPGIVFLSGGQSDELATAHLNAMNKLGPHPWVLSFSYGRALQASALRAWGGSVANVETAQKAFAHRAACNSAAVRGEYTQEMEKA